MRLLLLFLAFLPLPALLGAYAVEVLTQGFILALFALSFNLVFYQLGLLSFGHAAFFGAGAYTAALLVTKAGWPYLLTALPAVLVAGIFALVIGFFAVRTDRIYFTMLTLAFAQLLWAIVHKWYDFTGGDNGITGIAVGSLAQGTGLYYLSLLALAAGFWFYLAIDRSPLGYSLRAVRDNEVRAEAIGLSPFALRLIGFTFSGAMAGLAGFLQVAWQRSAFPDFLYWTKSAEGIIAAILGGSSHALGPVFGALAFVELGALVQARTEYWPLVLGLVLLVLVLFLPEGLIGLFVRGKGARG